MATLGGGDYSGSDSPLCAPASVMKAFPLLVIAAAMISFSALAADLSVYKNAYPFDEIGGYAFFDNPVVKTAIDKIAGDGISDWLAELGAGLPIELQDDGLIAIACEQ